MDALRALDLTLVLLAQSLGTWLAPIMQSITELGNEAFYIIIGPGLFWSLDAGLGLRVAVLTMATHGLNQILKLAFHTPRPYWISTKVQALSTEPSFGFPSGHAQDTTTMWGAIALGVRRRWMSVAIAVLVFLIGFSRVYLGVHFVMDALGGWLIAGLFLWLVGRYESRALRWLQHHTYPIQMALVLVVSLGILLLAVVARLALAGWDLPVAWVANAAAVSGVAEPIHPFDLAGTVTVCGALLGIAWGALWTWRRGGYDASGLWWQRLARFVLGLAGVLVLWMGLGAFFPDGDAWLPYFLRYLRYAMVGFWISGIAPMVFYRLGLARPPIRLKSTAMSKNMAVAKLAGKSSLTLPWQP